MQTIIPHLWFDKEAKEAAEFYVAAFGGDSAITSVTTLHNTPSGDCDTVSFKLGGYEFLSISAGPYFKLNPSVSFMVNFDPSVDTNASEHLDALWEKLIDGGTALMPLQEYPFSKRYGWVQDKYGVSWQLMLSDPTGEPRPFIIPSLLFVKDVCGKADEAIDFYVSVFKNAKRGITARYSAGMEPDKEGNVMFADFQIGDQWFAAMDSARMHDFSFSEAISLLIRCKDQAEIDYYWNKLSAVPEAEQCGWLKDKYGLSWQVSPIELDAIMTSGDQEKIDRVTQAFLPMKKFDLEALRKAAEGK
jgi:predicted 3-demethylubiquinone-9 3-methyltransferase (glyoxalase superfamily)